MAERLASYEELVDLLEGLPFAVKEARRRRHLSLRQAADEIGVSASTLSRFERREYGGPGIQLDYVMQIIHWMRNLGA